MKKTVCSIFCLAMAIAACKKDNSSVSNTKQAAGAVKHAYSRQFVDSSASATGSLFISPDVANKMISSYLYSINSPLNDSDIRSFSVNADSLRAYLADTTIKNVKLMFAHTITYINAGYEGQYAGYQSGALTMVIAGNTIAGTYVYYNGLVLDHLSPCPYNCEIGAAGGYLLQ
jgi:hypothetical protein